MKAVLFDALRRFAPGVPFRLSVMDTDYFAKAPLETEGHGQYDLLPHNDTTTRDLWVATGEVSRLFGGETVPSREMFHRHGVHVERIAAASDEPRARFLDRVTEAWGWTGLVFTGSRRTLAGEIPLSGVRAKLIEQLRWGFGETAESLENAEGRARAHAVAETWIAEVEAYADTHPDASLTDLYRHLLPRLTAELNGPGAPVAENLEVGGSLEMFRFNRMTASGPQFELLDLFLRPDTRDAALDAYNDAVRGSNIYTMDRFAPGAIPFDLVVPGRGRGTLRIIPERIIIELEERIYLRIARPIESVHDLADAVQDGLGCRTSLVGKALTLIAMLARSALVTLNETGSNYVWRTRNMMDRLCERGISFSLYPIVRLLLPTWDTMGVTGHTLRLPDHLAQAFGTPTIPAQDFSERWKHVRNDARAILEEATHTDSPRATMEFLARHGSPEWRDRHADYEAAQNTLLDLRGRLDDLMRRSAVLRDELRRLKADSEAVARSQGDDYRCSVRPLREALWNLGARGLRETDGESAQVDFVPKGRETEVADLLLRLDTERRRRQSFVDEWQALRSRIAARQTDLRDLSRERAGLLRESRVTEAREQVARLQLESQAAQLEVVRNAWLTAEGLEHGDHRPAAWWLLLLDPSGAWFRELRSRARAYLEPLSCCYPPAPAAPLQVDALPSVNGLRSGCDCDEAAMEVAPS